MTNFVLISYDCVRADIAYSGRFKSVERLKREGVCFAKAVSSAPLTPISHATVFSGLQPRNHGVRHLCSDQLRTDIDLMAEVLQATGMITGGFVACPGLSRWYGFDRGFRIYRDEMPRLPDGSDPLACSDVEKRGLACRPADEIFSETSEFLRTYGHQPFFLFAHFFDAHWPYKVPETFEFDSIHHPYEAAVAYVDHHVSMLLDILDELNLAESTLVIGFGDHGEDLNGAYSNDHAGEAYGHPEEKGHGCLLYDTTQLVPLLMRLPDEIPCNVSINSQVRLTDVLPTALELLNIGSSAVFDGESLVPLLNGEHADRIAYFETYYPEEHPQREKLGLSVRGRHGIRLRDANSEWKIIWDTDGGTEVYDLVRDPNERNNLLGTGAERLGGK